MYDEYLQDIKKSVLFKNMEVDEIDCLLECLHPVIRNYSRNQVIHSYEDCISTICIVLSGRLKSVQDNVLGMESAIQHLQTGECFGYAFAQAQYPLNLTLRTAEPSSIMFIKFDDLVNLCNKNCPIHAKAVRNLLEDYAQKVLMLTIKTEYLQIKTIRDKVRLYLLNNCKSNNQAFYIDMNQTELAEYLGVSRPALANELGKMKQEGIIDFNNKCFKIIDMEKIRPEI